MIDRVQRACSVPGWMTPGELSWLAQTASGANLVIEIGSWKGRSSVALAAAKRLVCVDLFVDQPQEGGTMLDIFADFEAAVATDAERVTAIRGNVADAVFVEGLAQAFAGKADMVFIDASHDEASVRRDIATATRLVREGGVLSGHDFSPAWPGVVAAVVELLPGFSVAADSIWWRRM